MGWRADASPARRAPATRLATAKGHHVNTPRLLQTFLSELRRRRVLRVLAAYAVAAWLILQIAEVTFEPLGFPDGAMRMLIMGAIAGLPITFVLAWLIEIGPNGFLFDLPLWPVAGERRVAGRRSDLAIALAVLTSFGLDSAPFAILVTLGLTMFITGVYGWSIERVAYRPLRGSFRLAPLITAIGMSLLLQTVAMIIWKPNPKPFPPLLPVEPIDLGGPVITVTQILILGLTAMILAALTWLVNRTKLGRAMRATAENPRVASLMGVKPDFVISATFVIGAALAAVAGIMWAANYGTVQHAMGFIPGLKAFTAAVLGGIGNLAGAVVGALLLGLVEALGAGYLGELTGGVLGSNYADIFAFVTLILVLTLRPQGLLGERVADRA